MDARRRLLDEIDRQRGDLDRAAAVAEFDRNWQKVTSLLTDGRTRRAMDVMSAGSAVLERYEQSKFGWSLLMARRLVEAGVAVVQVNLGHNFTWDTHGAQFPILKDRLLPPADRALSALLDDLFDRGLMDDVLVVLASEFGRSPKLFRHPGDKTGLPGRDHWAPVQTVLLAGGGVTGGRVVGKTDRLGGSLIADPHTSEGFAATIYDALGIPSAATWTDHLDRPHPVYHGRPIAGLT